jgi:hypothetical protein
VKFEFHNPTHLIFGAGTLSQLGEVARKHGKKALTHAASTPRRHTRGRAGGGQSGVDAFCRKVPPCRLHAVRAPHLRTVGNSGGRYELRPGRCGPIRNVPAFHWLPDAPFTTQLGIGDDLLDRYAQDTMRIAHDEKGHLPGRPLMSAADIVEVLRSAL